jgi:hypothetical protein
VWPTSNTFDVQAALELGESFQPDFLSQQQQELLKGRARLLCIARDAMGQYSGIFWVTTTQ